MTNVEFQDRLRQMYEENPLIARSKKKTVNEILYLLRMDKENDYNISMVEDGSWTCIPSVKECFVPVKTLARHVKSIECDDEDANLGCAEVCLTIVTEK
jgi:hypothetical protein